MTESVDKVYQDAVQSGLLPGISLLAGDKDGNIIYSNSLGKASLKESDDRPFTEDTICAIASMSKLMTSVAVLQCVEDGSLKLDEDVRPLLPEMGKYGVMTAFVDERNEATFEPDSTPVTLRMLLSHISGHEYDWLNPSLGKWRASRNEQPFSGPTIEDKSALPLVCKPGTRFTYGAGHDWAGKLVQIASGSTLEDFMRVHIWEPLGIQDDISFYPKTKESMKDRMATISTLNEKGEPPAVDLPTFDIVFGGTDCLGGAGLFSSAKAYYAFISALLRRDAKLLKPGSYEELFRPQLDEKLEQSFNEYIASSPAHTAFLGMRIPESIRKTWSFAGLISKQSQSGRCGKGTTFWAGVPSTVWFIDHDTGICGTAFCQILPPLHPVITQLHEEFQRGVFAKVQGTK
ncbi:beta-lactamase/transpeptidase-like protein [Annulohypoxylon truncatum]|uniref:beta-lactamase/transpeptidase-like protein n=1 Tax=Annulohypoxylon truncatum TaxID=327061 RepID=UPI002007A1A1|nr:beta-lactamase/transpeptidase-like protein [Annulohypoxylon truncatum]KAI1206194.1 beta-lactamase/transpeptidase-like protein [Annulohypoxylon truncatum]